MNYFCLGTLKEVRACIYDFLWKGKRDTIKCVCMINDFSKGGIRVTDIRSKITALKHVKVGRGDKLKNFDLIFFPTSKTWKGLLTTN